MTLKAIPGLLAAIIFHEIAHGYVAYWLGDKTAKSEGRLSLNPLNHIDPVGLLSMLIFKFGWAKAVPINPSNFKRPSRDMILVSLAGPMTNLILSFVGLFVIVKLDIAGIQSEVLQYFMWYNIMLGLFNLIPLPPLDGSKIVVGFLPNKWQYYFYRYQKYSYFLLIILIFTGAIQKVLGPVIETVFLFMIRIVVMLL